MNFLDRWMRALGGRRQSSAGADFGLHLWDAHACLNALNRAVITDPQADDDSPLYLLAQHLRLLAQLSKAGGRADPQQLNEWLDSALALHQAVQPALRPPRFRVEVSPTLGWIEVSPIGRALFMMLRRAGPVASIEIATRRPPRHARHAVAVDLCVYPALQDDELRDSVVCRMGTLRS